jgi:ADP-heptose:LPS heptosyltransferase
MGKRTLPKDDVKKILVIELTELGDVVSTLSLFAPLKEFFQNAELTVLVQSQHASLFPVVPEVDHALGAPAGPYKGGLLQTIKLIRKQKFDLVISASPSFRHGVLALLSGAKYKFGYLDYSVAKVVHLQPHRIRAIGFKLPQSHIRPVTNLTERPRQLCEALGLSLPDGNPKLEFLRGSPDSHSESQFELGLGGGVRYIALHPFASWSYRTWPLENFKNLMRSILDSFGDHILVITAEAERERVQPLIEEFGRHPRVHFGIGLPLDRTARLLARAKLFIGADSGPLHLAASTGTPCIGLFGPAPPELTGPALNHHVFLYKKVECSPCDQEDCVRKWAPCMTLISVEEVLARVTHPRKATWEPSMRRASSVPNPKG